MSKKYGLILSDKAKSQQPSFQASRNVFGNDSDSDEETGKRSLLLRPSDNINRQAKVTQEKAVLEDPTVYQYDEIYDSMVSKKEEKISKSKEEKKPRYIEDLLKTANKRKIENERRLERQIQKEREKEGDEFADKEVFVTSAYKKKLEELQLEEEREKREEYLENIGDVTKQKDLGGFYRHLYEQKLGKDSDEKGRNQYKEEEEEQKEEQEDNQSKPKDSETIIVAKEAKNDSESLKKRNYRKRKSSSEAKKHLSEGEIEDSDDEINRVNMTEVNLAKKSKNTYENIDADSDFSVDDASSDDDVVKQDTKTVADNAADIKGNEDNSKSGNQDNSKPGNQDNSKPGNQDNSKPGNEDNSKPMIEDTKPKTENIEKETVITPPKPNIDIWKKRTVGEVFEQALKRYYERKASRGM